MGRQNPGKWIRNLLLGKKSSSKSNSSKKKDVPKLSSNKDVLVVSSEGSMPIPTVTSPPTSGAYATKGVISENEVGIGSSNERVILAIGDEDVPNIGPEDHAEKIRLTEAAIIAQAAFRGYQERRKFQILKGIVPLQALIRGQLVRREAVSALYCVNGIVKFQALARGYKVRNSGIGLEVQKICKNTKCSNSIGVVRSREAEKLSDNAFILKLLASSPSTVFPNLKYESREPNLASEWLNRWTRSHFWAPLPESKKLDSVSEAFETSERKVKGYPEKDSNDQLLLPNMEHSLNENEKSNSKKSRTQNASDRAEVANEKGKQQITRKSSEKKKDLAVSKSKHSDLEKSAGQKAEVEHSNVSHDNNVAVLKSIGKDESVIKSFNGGSENCFIISSNVNDDDRNFQRRASLPANFTNHNNDQLLQETTPRRVPNYMAPTESAKAKLRGQCSPRFNSDLEDKNGINRRLSLSSSLNGKLGLFSPRSKRSVAMNNKTDRSLSSSRDWTDKLMQPQWKR